MVRTCRKLPKEWAKYEPVGNVVAQTRLFAFKTPLHHDLVRRYLPEHRFTVPDFYRTLCFREMPLGLVINATNTERYYDPREVTSLSYEYQKLPSSGRSFVECELVVRSFIKAVDEFLEKNQDNNLLIGVHCTDGVNRAGFLICRYLIDRLCMSSHDALNAVEAARGYTIERGALVQGLHRADRARRMKKKRMDYESEEEEELTGRERRRKKRRLEKSGEEGFDPQMLKQMYLLEQTLRKNQAEAMGSNPFESQETITSASTFDSQQAARLALFRTNTPNRNISEASSPYIDSQEYEEEEGDEQEVDLSTLGKVTVKEVSATQSRRQRRRALEKKYDVMKSGQFWKIHEMRNS
ncbi:RNA/RNP complex-1-interacting phosphatase [Aphelenchoides fujianensis]|nr:RNA/RNP complex-1-interacting phosphatase [Aphelenchoides fujianensis]